MKENLIEMGGVFSRRGFTYQDHIAIRFCIDMLMDDNLKEVWLEVEEDIVLIWNSGNIEFVQAKDKNVSWTMGRLRTERIIDNFLSRNTYSLKPLYRMITSKNISNELAILMYPIEHTYRNAFMLDDYLKGLNGIYKDTMEWFPKIFWEVLQDSDACYFKNIHKILEYLDKINIFIEFNQVEILYNNIFLYIKNISEKILHDDRKITKLQFYLFLKNQLEHLTGNSIPKSVHFTNIQLSIGDCFWEPIREPYIKYKINPRDSVIKPFGAHQINHNLLSEREYKSLVLPNLKVGTFYEKYKKIIKPFHHLFSKSNRYTKLESKVLKTLRAFGWMRTSDPIFDITLFNSTDSDIVVSAIGFKAVRTWSVVKGVPYTTKLTVSDSYKLFVKDFTPSNIYTHYLSDYIIIPSGGYYRYSLYLENYCNCIENESLIQLLAIVSGKEYFSKEIYLGVY